MKSSSTLKEIEHLRGFLLGQGLPVEGKDSCSDLGYSPETHFDIFVSGTIRFSVNTDTAVDEWVRRHLEQPRLESMVIPVEDIDMWHSDHATGNIAHDSGRFFSITGLRVRHRSQDKEISWDQPIIDQPEVGILGLLAAKFDGVLHFCLQAKEEPGNINSVQLAPTVQATYSNYTQVHGGKLPLLIDLFLDPPEGSIMFSKLQPEDGGRFLYKSNKNMIVLVREEDMPPLPENFIWLTLRQISGLLERNNLVNSCARSVLSCML